jgi:Asp-tRNA(Asn)/Glu-tRNA(Gln) amidotransferase B subunit
MATSEQMKENNNAEKWTLEEAESFCEKVLLEVQENDKCRSLATACSNLKGYEGQINYLQDKFNIVFQSIKEAKEIIKSRLIEQGLDNKANTAMAIFILKNNHDMADKTENRNTEVIEQPLFNDID